MTVNYKINEESVRPWGTWKVIDKGENYVVKKIIVSPMSSLSLQMHNYREENWFILKGTATVTIGEDKFVLCERQKAYIPVKTKHRLENLTENYIEFIEIQTGDKLDENDIIRFDDLYNRL